ncbi:HD-GYP domain-containing protein [Ferdinandcohnia quinoae]|uniref:HD-GYP domain-containing protein n=1 Tax=Fredinandcohnia quinoae TaxID=2918902 RepID=A0AAW5ECE0_9BACI|nr:HD-GYP domain-containing protein [Fredinandcohnia sp. SECRCQ15]MCH1627355.1 HD-GYP domain-containing protein [Fredinandcohnia sp. SECRCQ15]
MLKNTKQEIKSLQSHELDHIIQMLENDKSFPERTISLISQKIDDAVNQIQDIFNIVKQSDTIPLNEIKENILPIIKVASATPHFFHLFFKLQSSDEYTYRHNIGVGIIATLIGKWLSLPEKLLAKLTIAAILHDIGKVKIPLEILNKPGKLTKVEYEIVKQHTILGYEILKKSEGVSEDISLVALQHHEREDGKGYPYGIQGNEISYLAKIVAIADVFHAMSSNRVYHDATPFYIVIRQMNDDVFGKFDPTILVPFISKIMNSLIGNKVLLTDGSYGVIKMVNPYDLTNPLVQINNKIIDLSIEKSIQIERII